MASTVSKTIIAARLAKRKEKKDQAAEAAKARRAHELSSHAARDSSSKQGGPDQSGNARMGAATIALSAVRAFMAFSRSPNDANNKAAQPGSDKGSAGGEDQGAPQPSLLSPRRSSTLGSGERGLRLSRSDSMQSGASR